MKQSNVRKWSSLTPGSIIKVLVPQGDGTYGVQSSEIIQTKEDRFEGFRSIRFKITSREGKRIRVTGSINMANDSYPFLCMTSIKVFTSKMTPGEMVITTVCDDDAISSLISELIMDEIRQKEAVLLELQNEVAYLKSKI